MRWLLNRLFSVQSMLPATGALGEIPTTKEVYQDVTRIALPSVLEMVLMSLIGAMDTVMVGELGSSAIAAVGLVGQPRMLVLAIFFAINIGVTSIVARRKGEGRQAEANQTLRNAVILIAGMTVVLMALALCFSRQLMQLAGAQADTIDNANTYFRIIIWFLPVNALTMCICAAQRGVGNTRITMYVNVTSNVVNVILNYLLIGGRFGFPRLEVAGAAYATVIGFCVGFVLCVITVMDTKKNTGFLRFSRHDKWRLDKATIKSISNVGGNAMLEQLALRFGFFLYARIVADLGTQTFAAHQICMQFLNLSFTFGDGIGVAGTSLVGQMLGQKRPDLSQIYGKVSQRMAIVVAFSIATCVILFRYPLVSIFVRPGEPLNAALMSGRDILAHFIHYVNESQVLALSAKVMLIVAAFQPFQMSSVVISGALRGAGDTKYVAIVMMICVAVLRPVLSFAAIYVIANIVGRPDIALMGAWGASLIDMTIRLTCVYRRFNGGKWHDIKV